jgi:hypothetical protein
LTRCAGTACMCLSMEAMPDLMQAQQLTRWHLIAAHALCLLCCALPMAAAPTAARELCRVLSGGDSMLQAGSCNGC